MLTNRREVHCRIGSSEMRPLSSGLLQRVHCRIGSSEMQAHASRQLTQVHCRIGSSEICDREHRL